MQRQLHVYIYIYTHTHSLHSYWVVLFSSNVSTIPWNCNNTLPPQLLLPPRSIIVVIIPHAMSCGGYNVFDYTPHNELRRVRIIFFRPFSQSVCQSVLFFLSANSSETPQQNFLKLCSNEGLNVKMCISTGNSDSIFFYGSNAPFGT